MEVAEGLPSEAPIVALVDDDDRLREAMADLLSSAGIASIAFSSAKEVVDADLPDRAGCFVLDVRMPGLSGFDLHEILVKRGIQTPVIFLTAHGDIAMGVEAMKAGAQDFLTKPVGESAFLNAVTRAISADVTRRESSTGSINSAALYGGLTARERQVFKFVVEGYLNKQIGFELGISEVTVKLHKSNLMKKMQATSFMQLFNAWQLLPQGLRDS